MRCFFVFLFFYTGLALAWNENVKNNIAFGGPLKTATLRSNVWDVEVKTSALNDIEVNEGVVNVRTRFPTIEILYIRSSLMNSTYKGFKPALNISPQINFNGMIDTNTFDEMAFTRLTAPLLKTVDNSVIGKLSLEVRAFADVSYRANGGNTQRWCHVYAPNPGDAFFGGISTKPLAHGASANSPNDTVIQNSGLNKYFRRYGAENGWCRTSFLAGGVFNASGSNIAPNVTDYSSIYVLFSNGISNFEFNAPIKKDTQWKVNIPVTVSYR